MLASILRHGEENDVYEITRLIAKHSVGEGGWRHSQGGNLKPVSMLQEALKARREGLLRKVGEPRQTVLFLALPKSFD